MSGTRRRPDSWGPLGPGDQGPVPEAANAAARERFESTLTDAQRERYLAAIRRLFESDAGVPAGHRHPIAAYVQTVPTLVRQVMAERGLGPDQDAEQGGRR